MNKLINYRYSYKEVKKRLTEYKLKATQQRIVIYEALLQLKSHPTAENIYNHIRLNNPSISLGTVYKTLDTFIEAGLAARVMSDSGHLRYDANTGYHNHIYCTNTNEIIDFNDPELNKVLEDFFRNKQLHNLKINDIRIQINGEKHDPEKDVSIN